MDLPTNNPPVDDRTTFYKNGEQVDLTSSEAISHQGGTGSDPWGGLIRSGWSKDKPTTSPVPNKPASSPTVTPQNSGTGTGTGAGTGTEMDNSALAAKQALKDQADFFTSQMEKQAKEFENYTADIARIDSENDPIIQSVKDTFARRLTEMNNINTASQNQLSLGGSRTGLKRYASQMHTGLVSNETTKGMNRISELESQKLTAIEEAKNALKSNAENKWTTFNNFMTEATKSYKDKVQAVKDLHSFLQDEEDRVYNQKIADIKLQQIVAEGQQATADSVASSIYSVLGDDINGNMQFITDAAKDYGIDPNVLIGAINEYAKDDMDNTLEVQKKLYDLGAKITEGEEVEIYPGIVVTGTKKKDEMWVENIVGGKKYKDLYVKENGEYVKKQRIDQGQAWKSTGGGSGGKNNLGDWDYAKEIIITNKEASDEELALSLRENTKLTDGDINSLIENRNSLGGGDNNDFDFEAVANELYTNYSKDDALDEIDNYDISEDERETLREIYMSKRAWYRNDPN